MRWRIFFFILLTLLISGCDRQDNAVLQGYIEGEFIFLSSRVSGNLEKLFVYRGDHVQKGQQLFILESMPEQAQLRQASYRLQAAEQRLSNLIKGRRRTILAGITAQLSQAQATLALAKTTRQRNQRLFKTGAIDKATLDNAVTDHNNALQKVHEIEAALAEAKLGARENLIKAQSALVNVEKSEVERLSWILQQKTISAPVAASVYDTFYKVGEFIPASRAGVALLAPENVKLIFFIPEPLLSTVTVGEKVSFDCDNCKTKTTATIAYISTQAEYTPPVIYSKDSRDKLVFRVEAKIAPKEAVKFNPGAPVDIYLEK